MALGLCQTIEGLRRGSHSGKLLLADLQTSKRACAFDLPRIAQGPCQNVWCLKVFDIISGPDRWQVRGFPGGRRPDFFGPFFYYLSIIHLSIPKKGSRYVHSYSFCLSSSVCDSDDKHLLGGISPLSLP